MATNLYFYRLKLRYWDWENECLNSIDDNPTGTDNVYDVVAPNLKAAVKIARKLNPDCEISGLEYGVGPIDVFI